VFTTLSSDLVYSQELYSNLEEHSSTSSKINQTSNKDQSEFDQSPSSRKVYPTINLFLSSGDSEVTTTLKYLSNTTLGLDPGYDAGAFEAGNPTFAINTHLVSGSIGTDFTLQCLPNFDYSSYAIPLSVYASAGSNLSFSSTFSGDLPEDLHFYLEDVVTNQITDIKVVDYELNNLIDLAGIGRFYLHTTNDISTIGNTLDSDSCQVITFPNGWYYYSSYINEENMDVAAVFDPIADAIELVKRFNGDVYFPEWNFNGIGNLSVDQSYMVKSVQEVTFETCGTPIYPELTPLELETGWNLIPYLRVEPAPVIAVLADLNVNNNLIIVKDYLGNVYLPELFFDGIGEMEAGQGYQLKVNNPAVLEFLSNEEEY
tara:strand:+ start:1090 stop:2205 length:1116 start_codon:yes stop_codon:yes gene_type:complete